MIHLIDKFYLDADDKQFILVEWDGTTRERKGRTETVCQSYLYFTSFDYLMQRLALIYQRRAVAKSKNIEELIEEYRKIKEVFEKLALDITPAIKSGMESLGKPWLGVR